MNDLNLIKDVLDKDIVREPIRKGFGRGLLSAGKINVNVVAACADLTESTQMSVTVGSGMAAMGKIPFVSSYAAFNPGRNWEQIRTTICLNDRPVKIVGSHAGVSVGPDGATHQMLEDIALMRVLPNMVVIAPGDSLEAERATLAMASDQRPTYIRLAREATPIVTTDKTPFEIGKAYVYKAGKDLTIMSTGTMTYQALAAAAKLEKDGIHAEVIHIPTIKPLDEKTIIASAKKTGKVITVEEGQIIGGLGGAIAELLSQTSPTKVIRMGMQDRFGESGKPDELLEHFGLTAKHIAVQAHHLVM